jgi:hypothetical protein
VITHQYSIWKTNKLPHGNTNQILPPDRFNSTHVIQENALTIVWSTKYETYIENFFGM